MLLLGGSEVRASAGTSGSRPRFPAGAGARRPEPTEAGAEDRDGAGPEMAPPAGGAAAARDPGSAAVLLAVHAAVRPLAAGPDAESQLRRLQLSADPQRPGRFRLELLGSGPGAVSGGGRGALPGGPAEPRAGSAARPLRLPLRPWSGCLALPPIPRPLHGTALALTCMGLLTVS